MADYSNYADAYAYYYANALHAHSARDINGAHAYNAGIGTGQHFTPAPAPTYHSNSLMVAQSDLIQIPYEALQPALAVATIASPANEVAKPNSLQDAGAIGFALINKFPVQESKIKSKAKKIVKPTKMKVPTLDGQATAATGSPKKRKPCSVDGCVASSRALVSVNKCIQLFI